MLMVKLLSSMAVSYTHLDVYKRQDIGHGIGRKKAAAFAAVKEVLQQGKVIDYQRDWKGRGYDTAVIAAPVTIGGEPYLMGAVVIRNDGENRFYPVSYTHLDVYKRQVISKRGSIGTVTYVEGNVKGTAAFDDKQGKTTMQLAMEKAKERANDKLNKATDNNSICLLYTS